MLKPALRIAAILTALLSPSLAPAQSYELLHDTAEWKLRAVCFSQQHARNYLAALHFQMEVLGKTHRQATHVIHPRLGGRGDIDCYNLRVSTVFKRPPNVIDVVELDGLDPWTEFPIYGVAARSVTTSDGTVYTRQNMGVGVYVVVADYFVRKRP